MTPRTVACQTLLSMGILQARMLEWVAMSSSRGSSQSSDQIQDSHIAGRFLIAQATNQITYDYTYSRGDAYIQGFRSDIVPEELWREFCNTVQVAVTKNTQKKKKCKKVKWFSEESLKIAEEIRKEKGKGERERYTQLNAEFQRIARRDKKAFFQWRMQRNRGKK